MKIAGMLWRDGVQSDAAPDLSEVSELLTDPDALFCFDIIEPDDDVRALLTEELGVPRTVLDDALAPRERPRAVRYDRDVFASLYAVRLGEMGESASRLKSGRISIFALKQGLIVVRPDDDFDFDQVRQRWNDEPILVGFGAPGLLQGLLDVVMDSYFDVAQELDDDVEKLEDDLFAENPDLRSMQERAYSMRRELVEVRRLVVPLRDVINLLIRVGDSTGNWSTELRGYYDDLYNHALRLAEWTESLRDLVASIHETNLALNDLRMNEVMKKLAGWAAIIAVPTMITGWFGMNVPYFGFGHEVGMWLATGLVLVSAVVLYVSFKRRDWL